MRPRLRRVAPGSRKLGGGGETSTSRSAHEQSSCARKVRFEADTRRDWDPRTFASDGSIPDRSSATSPGDSTLAQAKSRFAPRRRGVWSGRRLAVSNVGARADALRVRDERGAAVIRVFESARDAAREQAQLTVERRLPVSGRHRFQVSEGRLEPPRDLREAAGGEPDLVERETDVAVPVEYALDQPQVVVLVAEVAVREGSVGLSGVCSRAVG